MGKEIDRQESPKELGKHMRLWFHEDIIQILAKNTVSLLLKKITFYDDSEGFFMMIFNCF